MQDNKKNVSVKSTLKREGHSNTKNKYIKKIQTDKKIQKIQKYKK